MEGFAKECAVVTHYRLETNADNKLVPSPSAELAEPLIIRPTSETIIGNAMSRWVQSYQDLPVLINQWCNVLRWEMRTRLFLRTTEFLWQEGHTAHATETEAMQETLTMLEVYAQLAEDFLAIPVIKGEKTPNERFPGAVNTYTIEAMMQDGKALQAGTSHFLGQNFSRAYEIQFMDRQQQTHFAWTTSWGLSTRIIGALIMSHSDDDGLVLPPRIAPEQVILLPVAMKEGDLDFILDYCRSLADDLKQLSAFAEPIRVVIDKTERRAGDKFWDAVKKGTPIRIEVGRREIESGLLSVSRRDKPAKEKIQIKREELPNQISSILAEIQDNLYDRALSFQKEHTVEIHSKTELREIFKTDDEQQNYFVCCYFDPSIENETEVADTLRELKLTTRCMPFTDNEEEGKCLFSGNVTNKKVILARAY